MTDIRNFWGTGNKVRLPRSVRAYFGDGAEYHEIDEEEKLLELGCCLWCGLDLYSAVKSYLENHSGYEESIRGGIAFFIEKLRTNNNDNLTHTFIMDGATMEGKTIKRPTLKQVVDLFSEELLLRYRPNYISQCYWNYKDIIAKYDGMTLISKLNSITPATDIHISEQELRQINPWSNINNFVNADWGTFINEDSSWLLKDDAYYIEEFNKQNKDEFKFVTNIRPEPFVGNPLTSRVVVLSLNPGYYHRINNMLAKALPPQLTEVVKNQLDAQIQLGTKSFMCESTNTHWNVTYRDVQNMIGNWYWYDIFENFRKEADLPAEKNVNDVIYGNVSLVQYIGYFSKSYKSLPAGVFLPSQRFTRLLIHHLAINRKDVLFVVSRSEREWRGLIGDDIWNLLEQENRLVHRKRFINKKGIEQTIRTQEFSRNSFADYGFDRIVNTLQSSY